MPFPIVPGWRSGLKPLVVGTQRRRRRGRRDPDASESPLAELPE